MKSSWTEVHSAFVKVVIVVAWSSDDATIGGTLRAARQTHYIYMYLLRQKNDSAYTLIENLMRYNDFSTGSLFSKHDV